MNDTRTDPDTTTADAELREAVRRLNTSEEAVRAALGKSMRPGRLVHWVHGRYVRSGYVQPSPLSFGGYASVKVRVLCHAGARPVMVYVSRIVAHL